MLRINRNNCEQKPQPSWRSTCCLRPMNERNAMPTNLNRNRARVTTTRTPEVQEVERTLNRIDFFTYSARVTKRVASKAEVQDRIRAKSLAGTANFVLR